MRDILSKLTDAEIELVKGRGGIFDIRFDGKIVYSKSETHSFPSDDEVRGLMS